MGVVSEVGWCTDPAMASDVARFFVAHADPAYISHSELQGGRALGPGRWSPDLEARIAREAARAIAGVASDVNSGLRLAAARAGQTLCGIAMVSFSPDGAVPFATLEDLLIAPGMRGGGLGTRMLAWVRAECRARGFRRLFLESGVRNDAAHRFFERHGFVQTSIVMAQEL